MFGGLKDKPADANTWWPGPPDHPVADRGGDLFGGYVLLPGERRLAFFAFYRDFGRFWGAVVVKLGLAVARYGWFWLANTEREETRAAPVTLAGLFMIAAGFGAIAVGTESGLLMSRPCGPRAGLSLLIGRTVAADLRFGRDRRLR